MTRSRTKYTLTVLFDTIEYVIIRRKDTGSVPDFMVEV